MGLRDFFRRRNETDTRDPIGLGDPEGEFDPGAGGPSFFRQELAELRWAAQNEALNVARSGIDPLRWDDGRLSFEYERALAHGHSGLRDRLANQVADRIREECRGLYSLATDVASARVALAVADEQLLVVRRDWKKKHREVTENELDVDRYYRQKSLTAKIVKYLIAAVFVIGEFIISGLVFERLFADLPPGLGYVLAFGVTLALILIPHYTALGLKEGRTQYHLHEKRELKDQGLPIPADLERAVHFEEVDDRGFRWTAGLVGFGLLVLIVPLSIIRARSEGEDFSWSAFVFLLALQYALCGYFFLREWLDHGQPSHSLHVLDEEKARLEGARAAALDYVGSAAADFHDTAEDLIFTITQAPRWDSYIVSSYLETIRYFRHLIRIEHPEAEQFITWARVPYLGSKESAADSAYPVDPIANEHMALNDDGPLGREWWLRAASDALAAVAVDTEEGGAAPSVQRPDVSWLVTKSPDQLLETFLGRYCGLPLAYTPPAELLTGDGHGHEPDDSEVAAGADSQIGSETDVDKELRRLFDDPSPATGKGPEAEAPTAERERD